MRYYNSLTSRVRSPLVLVGAILLAVALGGLWLAWVTHADLSPAVVRSAALRLGVWGPLALVVTLAGILVVPIIPASLLQIGAGLAFGPQWGLFYVLAADVLGASAGFWLSRFWGKRLLERFLTADAHAKLSSLTRRMTWHGIVLLRLVPGPAYPLVSFAAGHSPLGYGRYILASVTGVFPGLALLVLAGDLADNSPWLAAAIVVFVVAGLWLGGRLLNRS